MNETSVLSEREKSYSDAMIDREIELAIRQIEYIAAGYDGRHAGLFYFIPFCHDAPEQP